MPGKAVSPEVVSEAIILRAAGFTVTAIAARVGVSLRTLNRLFERHGAKKGEVNAELIEIAKRTLIEGITSNERIKEEAARLVADDLAHAWLLRSRMADATEHMIATSLEEAVLLMRAAAAYSTALKNTSDTLRHSLGTEKALQAVEAEDLPELVLSEISAPEALRTTLESIANMAGTSAGKHAQPSLKETGDTRNDDDHDRVKKVADEACS